MNTLSDWRRSSKLLLCVDSDGCAMDTMDIKHKECFGPIMVERYGLSHKRDEVLKVWNEINLYSMTRGTNRFVALALVLKTIEERGICSLSEPYDSFTAWTEEARELSNPALKLAADKTGDPQLLRALSWSTEVNEAIAKLPEENGAFSGVGEALAELSREADIAVVSSANGGALESEWRRCGLDTYIGALLGQEAGSKAFCISELLRIGGYERDCAVMVGDAPGDLAAAEKNGVLFYPILVGKEEFSWQRLSTEAIDKLRRGEFCGEYQEALIKEFYENLS